MTPVTRWTAYLKLAFKGALMGAADAVPGVSGGTIAFITGIYEELINSLKQLGPQALTILFSEGIGAAWKHINGTFLLVLFSGILVSLFSMAHVVLYLLEHHPVLIWAFFFGLILSATISVVRHVKDWQLSVIATFIVGAALAYGVTELRPSSVDPSTYMFFFAGLIAICAMILPGISGSFILILMGMYPHVLGAATGFDIPLLALFALGCIVGLLSFSHVLSWMFEHFKAQTLTLLGGFMLGSLNKVWPWKETLEFTMNRHGEQVPLIEQNVLPLAFERITSTPSHWQLALALMVAGAASVLIMEKLGHKTGH